MQIDLTVKNYRCFADTTPLQIRIQPGITSIVGVNNAGKSAVLRFLFEIRPILANAFGSAGWLAPATGGGRPVEFAPSVQDSADPFTNSNSRDMVIDISLGGADGYDKPTGPPQCRQCQLVISRKMQCRAKLFCDDGSTHRSTTKVENDTTFMSDEGRRLNLSLLYDAFQTMHNSLYVPAFRNAINAKPESRYFDIDVGRAFVETWKNYKTGPLKQANEAAARLTEEIRRILQFDRLEINASASSQDIRIFINDRSYRLDEVGSGIAQLFLVMVNASIRSPSIILIDEPEQNLHPSLQMDFVTTLASYATNGLIYATHSYGLARATSDRVYAVEIEPDGSSSFRPFEAVPRLAEFLGALNYSGYSQIGFQKVLLVEGATEVRTFLQLLRMYKKEHEIVLLPLGGAAMINGDREQELAEIQRIAPHVFAIVDSERSRPDADVASNIHGFKESCDALGIKCLVTARRATENYFTDEAVKKIKGEKYRALDHFELLKEMKPGWGKAENWRIAAEMKREDIDKTDIGQFLAEL